MGGSDSRPYIRFALISLCALVFLGAVLAFYSLRRTGIDREAATAHAISGTIGEGVFAALPSAQGTPLTAAGRETIEDAARDALLGGDMHELRVSAGGVTLAQSGAGALGQNAPERAPDGTSWVRMTGDDGAGYFVTRYARDGYIIEVAGDVSTLDQSIGRARLELLLALFVFVLGTWALLQGGFWFAIQRYRSDHERLVYLYDTGLQLRSSLDLYDVLVRLGSDATALAGGRFGFIALFDEETAEVTLKSIHDAVSGETTSRQRAVDEWYMRRCVATATTIISADGATAYQQYLPQSVEIEKHAALLCVPMSMRERVVGAIAIVRHDDGNGAGFTPAEVRMVQELAAQAVTAVEQAQLFAKVRADATTLENSYDSTLKALMAALDAKDDLTEGHCERVAKLTVHLAKVMNVPSAMIVHIERGALLHDVGKIGVPDGILKKPAGLNEAEWEAMRKHPLLAGLMVSKIGFLEPALPILLYHHEKWDGTGYPFGLSEENIPLEARIFSIIDAYDAMTSDRPYRPAMSHELAMTEIYKHTGSQFDPDVVTAFEELMTARPDLRQAVGKRISGAHDDHPERMQLDVMDEPAA